MSVQIITATDRLKFRTLRAAAVAIEDSEHLGLDARDAAAFARELREASTSGDYSGLEETALVDLGVEMSKADREGNDDLFNALREIQADIIAVLQA